MNEKEYTRTYACQTNYGLLIANVEGDVNVYANPGGQGGQAQPVQEEPTESEVCTEILVPEDDNLIFRTEVNGLPLDLERLKSWIEAYFIKRLANQYDWFALWRVLMDKHLIRNSKTTTRLFVEQMSKWFQDPPLPCEEGSINLYRSGYLGETPSCDWNDEKFENRIKGKQRMNGYFRLHDLCGDLMADMNKERLIPT